MATDIESLLGNEAQDLLSYQCKGITADELTLPGPDYIDRVLLGLRPAHPGGPEPGLGLRPRPAGGHRLSLHPPRRSGDRTLGRRLLRQEPGLLRSGQPGGAGHRGGRLGHRHHPGRTGDRGPPLRPQDPLHREAQPQRLPPLPEYLRRGHVRLGGPGRRARRRRGRGHHLLRLPSGRPPDPGGPDGLQAGPRDGPLHRLVVLPPQRGLQDERGRLPPLGRSHRPGQPHGRDHRGRHHQAEAAREQRRLQRARSSG